MLRVLYLTVAQFTLMVAWYGWDWILLAFAGIYLVGFVASFIESRRRVKPAGKSDETGEE